MGASKPQPGALALAGGKNVDVSDVIALLREVYADGIVTRDEAEELIAFDHSLPETSPAWREFFAEAIADHVVARSAPAGVVDRSKAGWLVEAISRRRRIATASGFAAVLRVIETAEQPTPALAAYAIDQIRLALIAGDGTAIGLRPHFSRMIDAHGVHLLSRVLTAAGGRFGDAVSRVEAEALFDLHDAVAAGANHAAFNVLFYRAIAHHLIAESGSAVLARREMLTFDPEAAPRESDGRWALPSGCADAVLLDADHTAWLASRIMRDGRPTPAEHALLRLFTGMPLDIDPVLRRSLEHAA